MTTTRKALPLRSDDAATFRVVGTNGGTTNFVSVATTERALDPAEVKAEKRLREAELFRQRWIENYFGYDVNLQIVPCDPQGSPL